MNEQGCHLECDTDGAALPREGDGITEMQRSSNDLNIMGVKTEFEFNKRGGKQGVGPLKLQSRGGSGRQESSG